MAVRSNEETALKLAVVSGIVDEEEVLTAKTINDFAPETTDADLLVIGQGLAGLYDKGGRGVYRVNSCTLKAA